jgi:hypothetical protein
MKMKGTMIGLTFLPFLLLVGPFIIQWGPLDRLIPYDIRHPYTPLVWPGVVAVAGVAVIIASRVKPTWPARRFTLRFNVAVTTVAALMTLLAIGFALNPT